MLIDGTADKDTKIEKKYFNVHKTMFGYFQFFCFCFHKNNQFSIEKAFPIVEWVISKKKFKSLRWIKRPANHWSVSTVGSHKRNKAFDSIDFFGCRRWKMDSNWKYFKLQRTRKERLMFLGWKKQKFCWLNFE